MSEFFNTTEVATLPRRGAQPRVESVESDLGAQQPSPKAQHVGVIVFTGQSGRRGIVHESGPNASNLVGRNRNANARATDRHAKFSRSIGHGPPDGGSVVGIVNRVHSVARAEVDDLMATLSKSRGDLGFEVVSRVVGAKGDAHCLHATRHFAERR